jgi:hypothetical protein
MKSVWLALLFASSPLAYGQVTSPFTFYVDNTVANTNTPLLPNYQLAGTVIGNSSPTVLKMVNSSTTTVYLVQPVVSTSATSAVTSPNFSVTGPLSQNQTLLPGASVLYVVNFTPTVAGAISGFFNVQFEVQQNGCAFTGTTNLCQINLLNISTMAGAAYPQVASPFAFYVLDAATGLPTGSLPTSYNVGTQPIGGGGTVHLKMVSTSQSTVWFGGAVVSTAANSATASQNFSVTGATPGSPSVSFTVGFIPEVVGSISGFLNVWYQVQEEGCALGSLDPVSGCPVYSANVSTFNGIGTAPLFQLSYQTTAGLVIITPFASSPLTFPVTPAGSASAYTFTISNLGTVPLTAFSVSLPTINSFAPSAFNVVSPPLPVIAAGQSENFSINFEPAQANLFNATLQVTFQAGAVMYTSQYNLTGLGTSSLQISYTNAAGDRTLPQSATTIQFPPVVPGSGGSSMLTFQILNLDTTDPVTVSGVSITGAAFSLSGQPNGAAVIQAGKYITFTAMFTPPSAGNSSGTLSIGGVQFSLGGLGVSSPIPTFTLTTSAPMSSQEQVNLTIQLSAPSTVAALGTVTLSFTPSVSNVADDSAIYFIATGGRALNISVAPGAQSATYNGLSAIAFETGTTAGTVTFAVAFPNTATYSQSFTIPPTTPQLTTVQAVRESPNLLVTVSGYDNAYSAGPLSFTFYDTTGKVIGSSISYNATSSFQNLFFTNNQNGGMFSLQANFPVTGDVTKVGSVAVGVTNSLGQSTNNVTFQ